MASTGRKNPKRRPRRRFQLRVPRGILAGYGSPVTASFYQNRFGDGEIVRGFDLVTSPYNVTLINSPNISYFITCNPASWNGTRIAAVASGYQNYRPLMFKIHYRPQVGSTSTLSMFIGTIWQNTYLTNRSTIEPSLVTSPGGTYLPAWQSSCSVVPLGRRLPQKMFPIRDPEFVTVPFSLVCRASAGGPDSDSVEMPGRIFIEYVYEFRNAIGSGGSSGFQPSTTYTVDIQSKELFSGTTLLGTRVITPEQESENQYASGWIIDVSSTTSKSAISRELPLFARFDTDEIVASTESGGDPKTQQIVQINGSAITRFGLNSDKLVLYTDDGRPT